ncbi:hypothetical protein [Algibacter mikhailovii]|uniref:Uncharacterized protein n=1 Tax=Algibacter mikhailovii TaxID=425498 RepID=A0A918R3K9_9FLAO|nr:hypothetical protein [Algibacter mikhailovii]GGZ81801.1 hypothetical protein GCM10007028_19290 [Algibacter mikhailovii]
MEVAIIRGNDCCAYCKSINSRKFDYNFAISNQIADASKCSGVKGFWAIRRLTAKRDPEDNLVFIKDERV